MLNAPTRFKHQAISSKKAFIQPNNEDLTQLRNSFIHQGVSRDSITVGKLRPKTQAGKVSTTQRILNQYVSEFPLPSSMVNEFQDFNQHDLRALKSVKSSGGDFGKIYRRMQERHRKYKQETNPDFRFSNN